MTRPAVAAARLARPVIVVLASLPAIGCAYQHSTSVTAPSAPSSTLSAGSGSVGAAPSLVGAWISSEVKPPSPSSCGNFQYQIATQTPTSIDGTFTVQCGSVAIEGRAQGQLNGTAVMLTISGSGSLSGGPACSFALTGNATIQDNGSTLNLPYSGTTCIGPVHGTEVLHRPQPASPPPAAPPPPPTPPPPPPTPGGPSDAIDLRGAIIENSPSDVGYWPATLTLLDLGQGGVHVEFTKRDGPGSWPDVPFGAPGDSLEYTLWIVLNINGRWYASGCIEYWRGLDRNGGAPSQYAQNWYYDPSRWGPMAGHQPAAGEQVGFLVTAGDARNNGNTIVKERSNVVMVPFPGAGGGTFTFSRLRTLGR